VVKTTSRCREMKIWFAGQGCMRMQCVVGSKADIENGDAETVGWSGVHMTKARKDEEMAVFREKLKRKRKEMEERRKLEAAERQKEEMRKAEEEMKKAEEERRVWQEEVGDKLLAIEDESEEWLEKKYNGEVGSDDFPEELREEEDDESDEGVDDVLQPDSDDRVWSSCKTNAEELLLCERGLRLRTIQISITWFTIELATPPSRQPNTSAALARQRSTTLQQSTVL
jgi:hypothetical protein